MRLQLIFAAGLCLLVGCAHNAAVTKVPVTGEPLIARVSVDKKIFDPAKDKIVNFRFYLAHSVEQVQVKLYDINGRLINTFTKTDLPREFNTISWDGKDSRGNLFNGDQVTYVIIANDKAETFTYDPDESAGQEIKAHDFSYDADTGKIHYVLPRAARVRLRAGIKEGPLLRTIWDWQPQEAGEHEFTWDGADSSGNLHVLKHPGLDLNLTGYTLADNSIILPGGQFALADDTSLEKRVGQTGEDKDKYFHYKHNPVNCHEPKFSIAFPDAGKTASGLPLLSGKVPVRLELAAADREYTINKRFEVVVSVDTIFLREEEEGISPLTFYWDTKNLNPGEHLLTINIISYDDHIGTLTQKVMIAGQKNTGGKS